MSLEARFYEPTNEAGYAGARHLLRVDAKGKLLSKGDKERVYRWLSEQDAYTLHRPVIRRFPRLSYNVSNIDDLWECDLMQFTSVKSHNDGYCYILAVIDVLSKYAYIEAIQDKKASTVAAAFERILKRAEGRVPICLQSDKGSEFVGSVFQEMLKKHGIRFRTARNPDIKSAVAERFIRTIKSRLQRYLTHKNTHRYIDVVQKIVYAYNHTKHTGTRFPPYLINIYNAHEARANLQKRALQQTVNKRGGHKRASTADNKYRVNDLVRISKSKNLFAKGYEKNFSEEIFKIIRVTQRQGLYIYFLTDLNNEEIDGFFYSQELTLVGKNRLTSEKIFKIERVLRYRGRGAKKEALVKWEGWPASFNEWKKVSDIQDI